MSGDSGAGAAREAFRLGAEPPKVARLSRKALAIVGVAAGLGIGGALMFALRPADRKTPPEIYAVDNRAKADAVTSAPKDYSQVPKLGAPLPGDLGRPILSAQQQRDQPYAPQAGDQAAYPANQAATVAREKAQQDLAAARASQLFLSSAAPDKESEIAIDASKGIGTDLPNIEDRVQTVDSSSPETAAKLAFLNRPTTISSLSSSAIEPLPSVNIVQAGSVIPAALITGIRSDLPGQISAQVTQNVFDSPTGRTLLIPQGSRLLGEYDSQVVAGQSRVMMVWTRLIFPDGRSLSLQRSPGGDAQGYAGIQDGVDNHWGGIARASMISTLLAVGSELASDSDGDLIRALRGGSQNTINQAGQQIVQRELAIRPTLTVRPGHPLRVLVTQDYVLQPWSNRQ